MEQYASASGVAATICATQQQLSALEIAQLAKNGDPHAIAAYALAANTLAQAQQHFKSGRCEKCGDWRWLNWRVATHAKTFFARLEADLIPVLRGKIKVKYFNRA